MWFPPAAIWATELGRVEEGWGVKTREGEETSSWWERPSWPEPLEPNDRRVVILSEVVG